MQEYFRLLNNYYDKIYVLSLHRASERKGYIDNVLKGLDFEYFWGVDKEETSLEKIKNLGLYSTDQYHLFYKNPEEISLGMVCCSLGHVGIYKDIIRNGYKKTLILEDDVVPIIANLKYFPKIVDELPGDWELFYLGYEKNEEFGWKQMLKQTIYKIFPPHSQLRLDRKIYFNYYPRNLTKHIAIAGFHDCTHAYSVTLEGAKKLLQRQQPVSFNPDNLLSYMISTKQVKGYISRPKLFNQLSAFKGKIESLTGN